MSAGDLVVAEAREDDLDRIRTLYAAVRGENRPRSFDAWRYFGSPEGACPAVVALDGETVAGFYTVWPARVRLGQEVVLAGQSMDTMTHPDYQGRGIFIRLAKACYDLAASRGYELLYGFPNPANYPGFVRRLNWDHTGNIRHWIRVIRPSRHPRVPRALAPIADLAAAVLPTGGHVRAVEIEIAKPGADELDALFEPWRAERGICRIERTREWLAWRYAPEAAHDYEWVCARRGEALVAAGAWGMRNESWGGEADERAHLVELAGADGRALRSVVATIIGRAAARRAWLLEAVTNQPAAVAAFRRAGFVSHRGAPLIVRALTGRALDADIHDHAAWRIIGGDVDTM